MTRITTVTKFFADRGFGFAEDENGISIFFHHCRGVTFHNDGGNDPYRQFAELPYPKKGDRIVMEVETVSQGFRAIWWGYQEGYTPIMESIATRPHYRMRMRVGRVKVTKLFTGDEAVYKTEWEGNDLRTLRKDKNLKHVKPVEREWEGVHFEVRTPEGWRKCVDPRNLS